MAFLDDLSTSINELRRTFTDDTNSPHGSADSSETERLGARIAAERGGMAETLQRIGETYMAVHGSAPGPQFAGLVDELRATQKRIAALEEDLQNLQTAPRCPSCGTRIAPGATFCTVCGARISQSTGAAYGTARCSRCGSPIRAGSKFCTSCGAPAPQPAPHVPTSSCPRCGASVPQETAFCSACGLSLQAHEHAGASSEQTPARPDASSPDASVSGDSASAVGDGPPSAEASSARAPAASQTNSGPAGKTSDPAVSAGGRTTAPKTSPQHVDLGKSTTSPAASLADAACSKTLKESGSSAHAAASHVNSDKEDAPSERETEHPASKPRRILAIPSGEGSSDQGQTQNVKHERGMREPDVDSASTDDAKSGNAMPARPGLRLCGQCGAPLGPDASFCNKCGTSVTAAKATPSPVGAESVACPRCGTMLSADAAFCNHCGASISKGKYV